MLRNPLLAREVVGPVQIDDASPSARQRLSQSVEDILRLRMALFINIENKVP
jgi:hypothetical protein